MSSSSSPLSILSELPSPSPLHAPSCSLLPVSSIFKSPSYIWSPIYHPYTTSWPLIKPYVLLLPHLRSLIFAPSYFVHSFFAPSYLTSPFLLAHFLPSYSILTHFSLFALSSSAPSFLFSYFLLSHFFAQSSSTPSSTPSSSPLFCSFIAFSIDLLIKTIEIASDYPNPNPTTLINPMEGLIVYIIKWVAFWLNGGLILIVSQNWWSQFDWQQFRWQLRIRWTPMDRPVTDQWEWKMTADWNLNGQSKHNGFNVWI